jgi:tetratricopeptide (TPR) repeat protein
MCVLKTIFACFVNYSILCVQKTNVDHVFPLFFLFCFRYANSGSFQKAIEDFESALKLNPNHQNARKYMGETLVALGRR